MPGSIRLSLEALGLLRLCARLSGDDQIYLVGGTLRDAALGRPTSDLDLAAPNAQSLAKALCRALGATMVVLDEDNHVYRAALPAGRAKVIKQIDVSKIQGRDIARDLARRDFSINAMALPLSPRMPRTIRRGNILDPRKGLGDLRLKIIRCESERLFREDPLRLLRAFRIASQLGFSLAPMTLRAIRKHRNLIRKPAGERVKSELSLLLDSTDSARWLKLMDEVRLLTALFPDLEASRRCALVYYGAGGVLTHSLETVSRLDFLLQNLKTAFPGSSAGITGAIGTRGRGTSFPAVLRLTALLHDVAKPKTARRIGDRLRFFGHDELGARDVGRILNRLRFSSETAAEASAIVLHHLRPGNLAANDTVSDRAAYRFFRDIGNKSLGLLLVCWADHASYIPLQRLKVLLPLAGRSPGTLSRAVREDERKTIRHLQVVALLMRRLQDKKRKALPEPLLDGYEVMRALGIPSGPEVGLWMERLREAQAEGKLRGRKEALAFLANRRAKKSTQ